MLKRLVEELSEATTKTFGLVNENKLKGKIENVLALRMRKMAEKDPIKAEEFKFLDLMRSKADLGEGKPVRQSSFISVPNTTPQPVVKTPEPDTSVTPASISINATPELVEVFKLQVPTEPDALVKVTTNTDLDSQLPMTIETPAPQESEEP